MSDINDEIVTMNIKIHATDRDWIMDEADYWGLPIENYFRLMVNTMIMKDLGPIDIDFNEIRNCNDRIWMPSNNTYPDVKWLQSIELRCIYRRDFLDFHTTVFSLHSHQYAEEMFEWLCVEAVDSDGDIVDEFVPALDSNFPWTAWLKFIRPEKGIQLFSMSGMSSIAVSFVEKAPAEEMEDWLYEQG